MVLNNDGSLIIHFDFVLGAAPPTSARPFTPQLQSVCGEVLDFGGQWLGAGARE